MKKIVNPTIVHSATQPSERADLWIKALPNNQNTLMIFDNGYENVDSNLTERLDNEAQERQSSDEELNNKINQETTNRVNSDNNLNSKITTNLNAINTINSKIPTQASSTNQLADKDFVNSSIANDAATFQGTFETVNDLPTTNVKKNDYAFIVSVTSEGNPEYKRYKYNGTQWIEEFVLNNSSFTANQWAAINSGVTEDWINKTTEALKNVGGSITEITWSELKTKRDAGELTPGMFYRITDYQCTTVQKNTRSAGNQFDIIVLALTNNTLSEQACAALHSGDTYFANSNLSAWKLWYCLDNDTTRFAWADNTSGNGRGVIYRMIDEFNNDVPYDFKNIQCTEWSKTLSGYFYTFNVDSYTGSDSSIIKDNSIFSNIINVADFLSTTSRVIPFILFLGKNNNYNYIYSSSNCTFGYATSESDLGRTGFNTFIFRVLNTFIYNGFSQNRILNTMQSCKIYKYCSSNIFLRIVSNTKINGGFQNNIVLGNLDSLNTKADIINCIFNSNLYNINIDCPLTNCFFSGINRYLHIYTLSSDSGTVEYYHFINLRSSSSSDIQIVVSSGKTYETKVGLNSSGELKQWCEADLVQ